MSAGMAHRLLYPSDVYRLGQMLVEACSARFVLVLNLTVPAERDEEHVIA
jgi:hypothetical protein